MTSGPDSIDAKAHPKQLLNIKIEGRVLLENGAEAESSTKNCSNEIQTPVQVWYLRFGHWLRAFFCDPNTFVTTLATIFIAFFTAKLYCMSEIQNQISATANRISILDSAPYVSIGNMVLDQNNKVVIVQYSNSGHWPAHFISPNDLRTTAGSQRATGANVLAVQLTPHCDVAASDDRPLERGQGYQWAVPIDPILLKTVLTNASDLWVVGCVGYSDKLGNRYSTPICRYYTVTNNRFLDCFFTTTTETE